MGDDDLPAFKRGNLGWAERVSFARLGWWAVPITAVIGGALFAGFSGGDVQMLSLVAPMGAVVGAAAGAMLTAQSRVRQEWLRGLITMGGLLLCVSGILAVFLFV